MIVSGSNDMNPDRSDDGGGTRTATSTRTEMSPKAATGERLREGASDAVDMAKEEARTRLEQGRESAAAHAEDATGTLDRISDTLAQEGHESLAQATSAISSQLAGLAEYFESHTVDEVAREAQRLVRRNPALLIVGGLAVGFALTRFLEAPSGNPAQRQTGSGGQAGRADGHDRSPGAVHVPHY